MIRDLPPSPLISEWAGPAQSPKPPRLWRDKFREAFRGVKRGVRGQSSFFVHFFFAVLAIAVAIVFECSLVEWCLLIFCIGGVLTAELFNSAIETLFRGLDEAARDRYYSCLDIAAGAVLVASVSALLVGSLIFGRHFVRMLGL
jgi:diacylglycerol kinase